MLDEPNFIITNEEYDSGILLEEYKDKYSLTSAYISSKGEVKTKWAFRQEWDKEAHKSVAGKSMPVKIELGTKDEAIAHLKALLFMLGWQPEQNADPDSVPF